MIPIILIVGFEKKELARLTLLIQKCLKTINKHLLFKIFFAVSHGSPQAANWVQMSKICHQVQ